MASEDKYLDPMNFQVINPSIFEHLDRPLIIGVGGGSKFRLLIFFLREF
jgi:hypothetical protein